ncbi:hypothetical protein RHECNPAF_35000102 [Rhizobium etli CNPAF512]|nr:hypothetical protein RHECNPAF_35000102 [Rhizobium etli CNPAF512]
MATTAVLPAAVAAIETFLDCAARSRSPALCRQTVLSIPPSTK